MGSITSGFAHFPQHLISDLVTRRIWDVVDLWVGCLGRGGWAAVSATVCGAKNVNVNVNDFLGRFRVACLRRRHEFVPSLKSFLPREPIEFVHS